MAANISCIYGKSDYIFGDSNTYTLGELTYGCTIFVSVSDFFVSFGNLGFATITFETFLSSPQLEEYFPYYAK